jgi:hypothetical protein
VSGVNTCNASACNVSVNNVPDNSCNGNVNALSVVVPNGCTDLNELSLPKFNNSVKQVVAHFLREIDEYFAIKKTPNELNFRFALGPLRTLLPNNGSRQFTTLSGHTRTLRQRSRITMGTNAPSSNNVQHLPRPLG